MATYFRGRDRGRANNGEWASAKYFRQKYIFDKIAVDDPYTSTFTVNAGALCAAKRVVGESESLYSKVLCKARWSSLVIKISLNCFIFVSWILSRVNI